MSILRTLHAILGDGHLSRSEYESFGEILDRGPQLTKKQRTEVKRVIDRWFARDALDSDGWPVLAMASARSVQGRQRISMGHAASAPMRAQGRVWLFLAVMGAALPAMASSAQAPVGSEDASEAPSEEARLVSGMWWRYEFRESFAKHAEPVTLVAHQLDGRWAIGAASPDQLALVLSRHLLPSGSSADGLSWSVHGTTFTPVRLPLHEGKSWSTAFGETDYVATVAQQEDAGRFRVELAPRGTGETLTYWYDEAVHGISRVVYGGLARVVLSGHGTDYPALVYVPTDPEHLVRLPRDGMNPHGGAGVEEVVLKGRQETAEAFVHRPGWIALTLVAAGNGPGVFTVQVTGSQAQRYEQMVVPEPGRGKVELSTEMVAGTVGTWRFDVATRGDGTAYADAIFLGMLVLRPDGSHETLGSPAEQRVIRGEAQDASFWFALAISGMLAFPAGRYAWPALVGLYSRFTKEQILEHPVRREIYNLVREEPGLTVQEMRSRLRVAWGTVLHHLQKLAKHGYVRSIEWGRERDWYPVGYASTSELARKTALRRPEPRRVWQAVRDIPGASQHEIADRLGVHHSTVFFHAQRLVDLGVLEKRRDGRRVAYYPVGASRGADHQSA